MPDLRVIVLNYKRQENVLKIVQALSPYFPVTVINNNPNKSFPYLGQPIEVINNDENFMCMERWVRCFEYSEEYKLVLDDDILPSLSIIERMKSFNDPVVGIYGKSGIESATSYSELEDHWCVDKNVDFLVGSAVLVKQSALNTIQSSIEKIGYPKRGDDIIVSYLLKKQFNLKKLRTVSGKVLMLPEGGVGLNTDPSHFLMRWKVIEKFKNSSW